MRTIPLVLVLTGSFLAALAGGQPVEIVNPGFETGKVGAMPDGWGLMKQSSQGFEIAVTRDNPDEGGQCLVLRYMAQEAPTGRTWAAVEQSIEARDLVGHRIRLSGRVRTEATENWGGGALWLRITRADGSVAFMDNMRQRLVRDDAWTDCVIDADVPENAAEISFGGLLVGGGDAWLDSFGLSAVGATPKPAPPAPLGPRGLENLTAFARILGAVRYFHPDAAGASIDWDAFTAASIPAIEAAGDASALSQCLEQSFSPIAPGIRVMPTGAPEPQSQPTSGDAPLRRWVYHGYGIEGTGQPDVYNREMVSVAAGSLAPAERVWKSSLPGGITCSVPLALPQGEQVRDPGAVAAKSAEDRSTRLADVITLWDVMESFHPYLAFGACDWASALGPALERAAVDADGEGFAHTLREMTHCLGDGHVYVAYEGEDRSAALPLVWRWLGDDLVVTGVGDALSGIKVGDRVLSIDGQSAVGAMEAMLPEISGSPQWVREQAPRLLLAGKPGTSVELQLESIDGETRKAVLRRRPGRGAVEPRPAPITEIRPGVWYVDLTRITDAQLEAALGGISAGNAVVFDLRGYPRVSDPIAFFGHLTTTPVTSAEWQVPVLSRPEQEGKTLSASGQWEIEPINPCLPQNRVFLTDGRAISYSESCMEIVKHFGLAKIVGSPTAGANGNVIRVPLAGGYQVTFTGMLVEHLDGTRLFGLGISPDVEVVPTREGIAAGRDEVLEAGLTALGQ